MHKNRILFLLAAFCFLFSCGVQEEKSKGVLLVGTNAEFAPFAFINDGEIQGFEIDLAKELCQRLGFEMELKDLPFESLIPELKLKKLDFVAAGMTVTEQRAQVLDFTKPYLEGSPLCLVYSEENMQAPCIEQLKDLRVLVNDGYTAEFYATDVLKIEPIRLSNPFDAMIALHSGRADVFITAEDTLKPLLKTKEYQKYSYKAIEGSKENCAILLPKGSFALKEQLDAALDAMKQDGTFEQIKVKWGLS